jgi:hypothetical protein
MINENEKILKQLLKNEILPNISNEELYWNFKYK